MSARYVLWRGERIVGIGTARELAERFCLKPDTVRWYATAAAHRRAERAGTAYTVAERIN